VRASFSEHQQVLDGILKEDPDLAAEALRKHVLVQGDRFSDLMAVYVEAMRGRGNGAHASLDHRTK
jgi:DNA-binding GntR family transcriptional regulator